MSTFKNVPATFICPLSMQVMIQPLVSRSGIHFERSAILLWLAEGSGLCPVTGDSLRPSDLVPDKRMEAQLAFWRENNGVILSSVLREKKDVFMGIASLGDRTVVPVTNVSKGFFPRIFRANKVATMMA
jgi:hypothetical protein